jgi:predicted phosphate transport protein (TIGR00153 family)
MPFANLANLFGRSPIKPMQEHMAAAVKAAGQLIGFFEAVTSDNWQLASDIQKQIVDLEHQADDIKQQLRLNLPKSLLLPVHRSDLLELITMQDRIANRAKDIAGIIIGRRMAIPSNMKTQMNEFVTASVAAAEQALTAINELESLLETGFSGREMLVVEHMIKELDALEQEADRLEIGVRTSLFALEAQLPPVDVMFLYNIIDWVGDIANRAHDVGGRLQLLLAQ